MTGLFGTDAYLRASAEHDGGKPDTLALGDVRVPVIVAPDGAMHTPYGYPRPGGDTGAQALASVAATAAWSLPRPWRFQLAPAGPGAAFAAALAERGPAADSRPICVHDLDGGDPLDRFRPEARTMVRRAQREGVRMAVSSDPAFGVLYRAAMDALDAPAHYRFADAYLLALNAAGAKQWLLHDEHGLAAAALFLVGDGEASYHLSARRTSRSRPRGGEPADRGGPATLRRNRRRPLLSRRRAHIGGR